MKVSKNAFSDVEVADDVLAVVTLSNLILEIR